MPSVAPSRRSHRRGRVELDLTSIWSHSLERDRARYQPGNAPGGRKAFTRECARLTAAWRGGRFDRESGCAGGTVDVRVHDRRIPATALTQPGRTGGAVGYGWKCGARAGSTRSERCGCAGASVWTATTRSVAEATRGSAWGAPAQTDTQVQPPACCAGCCSSWCPADAPWACPCIAAVWAMASWCGHGCSASASSPQKPVKKSSAQRADIRNRKERRKRVSLVAQRNRKVGTRGASIK
jgi:hypothetical protein